MPSKILHVWTTEELLQLINRLNGSSKPLSTRDYRQGYEDALECVFKEIKRQDATPKRIKRQSGRS